MAAEVALIGLDGASTALCWSLRHRGLPVSLATDGGDVLADFGGAALLPKAAHKADIKALLSSLDPALRVHAAPVTVVSSFGVVRTADIVHEEILHLGPPVHVVGFNGWREWSAPIVCDGLMRAGIAATGVPVQLFGTSPDASLAVMASRLADARFRAEIVRALKGAARVLLPPIFGVTSTGTPLRHALAAELGLPVAAVGCAIASVPSPQGAAHLRRVSSALDVRPFPTLHREGTATHADGKRDALFVFGPRASAALKKKDELGLLPSTNVHYADAPRNLVAGWLWGLERGAAWPQ